MAKWAFKEECTFFYSNGLIKEMATIFENTDIANSLSEPLKIKFKYELKNNTAQEKIAIYIKKNNHLKNSPQKFLQYSFDINLNEENPCLSIFEEKALSIDIETAALMLIELKKITNVSLLNRALLQQLTEKFQSAWHVAKHMYLKMMQQQELVPFSRLMHLFAQIYRSNSPYAKEIPALVLQLINDKNVYENNILSCANDETEGRATLQNLSDIIQDIHPLSAEIEEKIKQVKIILNKLNEQFDFKMPQSTVKVIPDEFHREIVSSTAALFHDGFFKQSNNVSNNNNEENEIRAQRSCFGCTII